MAMVALAMVATSCADPIVESAGWDPRVADIVALVEFAHGDTFVRPIPVRFVEPAEFDMLLSTGSFDVDFGDDDLSALMGFAAGDEAAEANADAGSIILGVYQDAIETLLVRGDDLGPATRAVVAHELTHALQDQLGYFDSPYRGDTDLDLASRMVIEGDATRIESRYWASLSDEEIAAVEEPSSDESSASGFDPDALSGQPALSFWTSLVPYSYGWLYVEAYLQRNGPESIDTLLEAASAGEISTFDVLGLSDPGTSTRSATDLTDESEELADSPFASAVIGGYRWLAVLLATVEPGDALGLMAGIANEIETLDGAALRDACLSVGLDTVDGVADRWADALGPWAAGRTATIRPTPSGFGVEWCGRGSPHSTTGVQFIASLQWAGSVASLVAGGVPFLDAVVAIDAPLAGS